MPQLKKLTMEQKDFFYSLSFDINDFVGDGVWWLQVYDNDKRIISDKPFASSVEMPNIHLITESIKQEVFDF